MGTELTRRTVDTSLPLWSAAALESAPDVVAQIHADYVAAGATVLTANTFRTNTRALAKAGIAQRARDLTFKAVALARRAAAAAGGGVRVAGSLAPVEDCYMPELAPAVEALDIEHGELARNLADAGVDLMLIETMNSVREAVAAARAAASTGKPLWVSFTLGADGALLSGETLTSAVAAVRPFRPEAVLVNCVPVAQIAAALSDLRMAADGLIYGAYGNVGHIDDTVGWTLTDAVTPEQYAAAAQGWRAQGAGIIGGCCGTHPGHIRALVKGMQIVDSQSGEWMASDSPPSTLHSLL